jgi:hypothetical protein
MAADPNQDLQRLLGDKIDCLSKDLTEVKENTDLLAQRLASFEATKSASDIEEKRSKKYGNWAQIASAGVAAIALIFVVFQIQTIKSNNQDTAERNRESNARQMFRSHLELEINNGRLATANFSEIKKAGGAEVLQYGSFVAHLLYTCEELTIAMPDDTGWRTTCEAKLWNHLPLLCDPMFDNDIGTYDKRFQNIIARLRIEGSASIPECARLKVSK